jgi:hypothetical protein
MWWFLLDPLTSAGLFSLATAAGLCAFIAVGMAPMPAAELMIAFAWALTLCSGWTRTLGTGAALRIVRPLARILY